jgi:hypothetical protein
MTDNIPALRRARAMAEKVKTEIADRRSKLTLAKPSDEQRRDHEEIRAAMRGMTPEARAKFIDSNRQNPVVVAAIIHSSIPALAGLDAIQHQNIVNEQMHQEHGETLAELADLEEVVGVVDRVTGLARDELREIIGVSKDVLRASPKLARLETANCHSESRSERSTAKPRRFPAVLASVVSAHGDEPA